MGPWGWVLLRGVRMRQEAIARLLGRHGCGGRRVLEGEDKWRLHLCEYLSGPAKQNSDKHGRCSSLAGLNKRGSKDLVLEVSLLSISCSVCNL